MDCPPACMKERHRLKLTLAEEDRHIRQKRQKTDGRKKGRLLKHSRRPVAGRDPSLIHPINVSKTCMWKCVRKTLEYVFYIDVA